MVKDLKDKSYFVEDQLESYEIEIIGCNHRRQALSELQQEGHVPESLKFVMSSFMQVEIELLTGYVPVIDILLYDYIITLWQCNNTALKKANVYPHGATCATVLKC